jgi:hypothetical protein
MKLIGLNAKITVFDIQTGNYVYLEKTWMLNITVYNGHDWKYYRVIDFVW